MVRMGPVKWLTYKQAAKFVGRSKGAIRLWGRQGMPLGWKTIDGQRARVVSDRVLLEWSRQKMKNSPVHQYRMRAIRRAEGLPDIPLNLPRRSAPLPKPQSLPTGRTAPEVDLDAPKVNPLAELPPMRAPAEWDTVPAAMKTDDPACWGIDAFTADSFHDDEERAMLADICAGCPLVDLCRTFAIAEKPAAGFWAGQPSSAYRRR